MTRIDQQLRDRPYSTEDLLIGINREIVPVVKKLIRAVNDLVTPSGDIDVSTIEPGTLGQYLRTIAGPLVAWADLGTVPLANLDPTGGADGDVVTRVAGAAAWATPSGGPRRRVYIITQTYAFAAGYYDVAWDLSAPPVGETITPVGTTPAFDGTILSYSDIYMRFDDSEGARVAGDDQPVSVIRHPTVVSQIAFDIYKASVGGLTSVKFQLTIIDPP